MQIIVHQTLNIIHYNVVMIKLSWTQKIFKLYIKSEVIYHDTIIFYKFIKIRSVIFIFLHIKIINLTIQ